MRIAVIGVGRIGSLHAELLARRVAGAELTGVADAAGPTAAAVAAALGVPAIGVEEALAGDADAVAICTSTDTHAELVAAAARAGKAIFCEKPVSLDLAEVDARAGRGRGRGGPVPDRLQPPLRPRAPVRPRRGRQRRGRRAPSRADLEPRPRAAAAGVRAGVRRDLPRHDDPRLRHGALRDRLGGRRGVRARRGPDRRRLRRGGRRRHGARHARARERLPDRDRQLAPGRVRLRPARRGLRFGGAWPRPRTRSRTPAWCATAEGTRSAALPHFFLERYIPSYVRAWDAFRAAVDDGTPTPVAAADARAPLVIGLAAWRSLREGRPVAVAELEAASR